MVNGKSCIKIDTYEGDKMQNSKLCVQWTHTKKGCKWNDMPMHTHYQNITCLTLLSWLMISNMTKFVKYTHVKIHIWLHMMHMHTPPKGFHLSMDKTHTKGKSKARGICE